MSVNAIARRFHPKEAALVNGRQDLATSMQATSLLVVNDTRGRSQDEIAKLPRRQQVCDPVLDLRHSNVETRGNNTALVQPPNQVHNNLPRPMVINMLKLANVP
jgi:hypothetical protein